MSQAEFVETYHKGGLDDFYITRGPEGHVSGNFGEFTSSLGAACSFLEWFLMLTVRRTLSHYFREFVGYMGFGLHRSPMEGCDTISHLGPHTRSSSAGNMDARPCFHRRTLEAWTANFPGLSWTSRRSTRSISDHWICDIGAGGACCF